MLSMTRLRIALVFVPIIAFLSTPNDSHAQPSPDAVVVTTDTGSGSAVTPAPVTGSAGSATIPATTTTTTTTTSTSTATTPPPAIDVIGNPLGAIATLRILWSLGWGVFLGGCALALAEIAAWLGKSGKVKALGDGRISVVIGGSVAVLSSFIGAVTKQSGPLGWAAVGVALVSAVLLYFNIQKNDPPAASA
jgi:acylphosphatase